MLNDLPMPDLHVLQMPSWYPTRDAPLRGIFFAELAQSLHASGMQIGVLALHRPRHKAFRPVTALLGCTSKTEAGGFPEVRVDFWYRLLRSPRLGQHSWQHIRRAFKQYTAAHGRPDIIHAHSARYGGYWASRLAQLSGIPYVLTEHSSAFEQDLIQTWELRFVRQAFGNATHLTMVSPALGRLLEQRFPQEIGHWEWVPNAVDEAFGVPSQPPPHGTIFRFLNVGSLKRVKGQDLLLRAFATQFTGQPVELLIAGRGPEERRLASLANELQIQQQVRFLGELARPAIVATMQQAHAFVLSSHYETFGVVVIEALACGLPVVATACGGPDELLKDDNGLLVAPGNADALGQAMRNMVDTRSRYDSKAISRKSLTQFGAAALASRWRQVYEAVLQAHGPHGASTSYPTEQEIG